MTCARVLSAHDIPALIRAAEDAQAVGPIMDPTLWRQKAEALKQDIATLKAALPLWEHAKGVWERLAQS